jgi:hypothetical protein
VEVKMPWTRTPYHPWSTSQTATTKSCWSHQAPPMPLTSRASMHCQIDMFITTR